MARNTPFAGAFISRRYGKPQMGQHAVQIEIDRSLYMDEARIRPSAEFDAVRRRLVSVIADIVQDWGNRGRSSPHSEALA